MFLYKYFKNFYIIYVLISVLILFLKFPHLLHKLKWINFRGDRNLENLPGKMINTTISKETNKKNYVFIVCEKPSIKDYYITPTSIVELDLGIKKLITLSNR